MNHFFSLTILSVFFQTSVTCAQQLQVQCSAENGNYSNGCMGLCYVKVIQDGVPPYTYLWSNGGTNDTIFNLEVGVYTVSVTDASGYTDMCSVLISENCCNVTNGGEIAYNEEGCGLYDPDLLPSVVPPSGGVGALEILWLKGTCGNTISTWTVIPGANDLEYDPPYITETTCFVRVSKRSDCSVWEGVSNIITKTVYPNYANIYSIGSTVICNGKPAILATNNSPEYTWSTGEHTGSISVTDTGYYWVTNFCGDTSDLFYVGMAELDAPIIEEIGPCQFNIINFEDSLDNQWLLNGVAIGGSMAQVNSDSLNGNYTVVATSTNGCVVESNDVLFCENTTNVESILTKGKRMVIFPNPTTSQFELAFPNYTNSTYRLFDNLGQLVISGKLISERTTIGVREFPTGIYLLQVQTPQGVVNRKLIKQ